MKKLIPVLLILCCAFVLPEHDALHTSANFTEVVVPLAGNTFQVAGNNAEPITENGIENWQHHDTEFDIYVSLSKSTDVTMSLHVVEQMDNSTITVAAESEAYNLDISAGKTRNMNVGVFHLTKGYNKINLKGALKKGATFAKIDQLILKYDDSDVIAYYVRDNTDNNFYWGRRGPSVHMSFPLPPNEQVKWFYNELTVSDDPIGSYFMANGFDGGYFGIQVNSETERRVLFSVWSPFQTDNPQDIPQDQRVKLISKGENVKTGEFGDEGSGGQSYLLYPWKAGVTYRFLNAAEPDGKGNTVFSAYFMDPEVGQWQLIAVFLRPKTNSWLTGVYSFVENFDPLYGNLTRKVAINNQWICNQAGQWSELVDAKFTGDNTARIKNRLDYRGGVEGNAFFLQNCGFFDNNIPLDLPFSRIAMHNKPVIDVDRLPKGSE